MPQVKNNHGMVNASCAELKMIFPLRQGHPLMPWRVHENAAELHHHWYCLPVCTPRYTFRYWCELDVRMRTDTGMRGVQGCHAQTTQGADNNVPRSGACDSPNDIKCPFPGPEAVPSTVVGAGPTQIRLSERGTGYRLTNNMR